jgi:hypothetical protein
MSSRPINVSLFRGGKHDHLFTHYIYHLTLYLKNDMPKYFEETINEKYINIFSFNNNIHFDNIISYELNIIIVSFNTIEYTIKNNFNIIDDTHMYKDNSIYIEFTKNKDNNTNCCIHLTSDNSRLFFTPPNY